jgi:hypothetical protein
VCGIRTRQDTRSYREAVNREVILTPESLKPLLSFLINLPHHDLCTLFKAIELAINELEYEDVDERVLCECFLTDFWIATKERGNSCFK